MITSNEIVREARYPHPPQRVWRALTDPAALSSWLMPTDFRPEVGARFTFRTDPAPGFDGIVHCTVLELVEPERMRWSWRGGNIDTEVLYELEPVDGGAATLLRFRQSGFDSVGAKLTRIILSRGAKTMYDLLLPTYLDGLAHAAAERPAPTGGPAGG